MEKLSIAAVLSKESGDADAVLFKFAITLRREGWYVRGLLQDYEALEGGCQISLLSINDGTRFPITQNLGAGSDSCRLDASQLAEASIVLRQIAAQGADLAIFNRFGRLEARGRGFRDEMLAVIGSGIPVLAIVPENLLSGWRAFTGNFSEELAPESTELRHWFFSIQGKRHQRVS